MRPMIFNENDFVLLVGEGNFSFSVALHQLCLKIKITATCYEANIDKESGKKNIEYLENYGVRVLLGVDATNLKDHAVLKTELFDKIIFNFPHVGGKMRIEKNRELLRKFFVNIESSLKSNGQVLVTLCNGQGGTSVDNPPRRWDDSWKITEMAAHGNFILTKVESFMWLSFENYTVTGYRSLDKKFHSTGALTHVFVKSEAPNKKNIAPNKKIDVLQLNTDIFTWKNLLHQIENISGEIKNKYSHIYTFDITFPVDKEFCITKFYITLYNYAGCIISDINFIRSFVPLSKEKEKRTYRISYKSDSLPLYRERVIDVHQNLITNILEENLNVVFTR